MPLYACKPHTEQNFYAQTYTQNSRALNRRSQCDKSTPITMYTGLLSSSYWIYPAILVCHYAYELLITKSSIKKHIPVGGCPTSLVPRFLLNLKFAFKGTELIQEGVEKVFKRDDALCQY